MKRFYPYLRYLKAVREPIISALAYGVLYGVASGAGLPVLIKYVFPAIFDDHGSLLDSGTVWLIAACIPLVFAVRGLSGYLNSYYIQLAGVRILESIRLDYFSKLQWLPLSFVRDRQSGDLISRGMADTAQLQNALTVLANDGIKQPATLIGALGTLAWMAAETQGVGFLLLILTIVPLSVIPVRFVGRRIIKRAAQFQSQLGSVTDRFSENLAAAREVRAFSLEKREIDRFGESGGALVHFQMKIAKYAQALTPAIEVISAGGIAVTLVFAHGKGVTLTDFVAIISALYFSYEPVKKLGSLNNEIKKGEAALERLEMVLNEPVSIDDPTEPISVGTLKGDLSFDDVTFAYRDNPPALDHVSTTIPAGTVCALVGPSGAGKSTFVNLVPRFYDVIGGQVTIDGHDIRAMRLAHLRRNIAIVSQDPVLFNDTILENLRLGRAEATREEIEESAKDAFAHDFILSLPQGYDTIVGERGASLSGGQRQRIAIARAFLRAAPILILDEATSALDSDSESAVQAALQKLVIGKTVLIIAHRFSTIRDASKILVFDAGKLVAEGTHAELHADNDLYRSLYNRQAMGNT